MGASNIAAMREALLQVALSCSACTHHNCKGCTRPFASFMPAVRKALALPLCNCDVGTADEQAERFHAFCDGHSSGIGGMCDGNCPCIEGVDGCHCLCKWQQLPYAEAGNAHETTRKTETA